MKHDAFTQLLKMVSFHRENIFLELHSADNFENALAPTLENLKKKQERAPKTIIYAR